MNLFYEPALAPNINEIFLNEQESHHAVKVLRFEEGNVLHLTNGKGYFFEGELLDKSKKTCRISIKKSKAVEPFKPSVHLVASPLKNRNRLEWLLEKAAELGVSKISLVNFKNTERTKVKEDRVERILISAMKQSLRAYLPEYQYFKSFSSWLTKLEDEESSRVVAECETSDKPHLASLIEHGKDGILVFGPEGDLAPDEIKMAHEHNFQSVSLGDWRLRTETAALTGVIMFNTIHQYESTN